MNNSQKKTTHPSAMTEGVRTLLGNPKKAIIKLAIPMIIAMSAHTLYSVVDAIWVSGLGPDALSAIGFFFPFNIIIIAVSGGLGVGGSSAISRKIGAQDKKGAGAVASHTLVLMIFASLLLMAPLLIFIEKIYSGIGAGPVASLAAGYSRIIFALMPLSFFSMVATSLLRGEGDVKRAMTVMLLGSALNIGLDPLFIYTFKLGVNGAAWATMISIGFSCTFLFYWMFLKKDTYVTFRLKGFCFAKNILSDILRVGIPSAVMQTSMALMAFFLNILSVKAGGTDGVAVFTTGWRVVMFAALPIIGMATAVTSVTGAAFGAHDVPKLRTAFFYAVKIGLFLELITASLTFIFAPQIAGLFTMKAGGLRIRADLINFLKIMFIFFPFVPFGMLSSAMFQGTGKGINALTVTLTRTIILVVPLAIVFSTKTSLGLSGIWWGIVCGNTMGAVLAFTWANLYIRRLRDREL
ncbi:MAG: MATE family efflux transporter [Acidobacteria bacterium]|nr:MATE family efflux transporter [Acidobacteriota bacterium]MCG2816048.1 MATE family efflux transporter [Candidatus Aminicenantes bacterium]MBU1339028.1 MATE family efflux transporter [Acidobacteriota bacterium]MBU1475563.1 MATE family efflux transporter [Acidobacteriota bacterium]MBU2439039.1 MATE family efflux transporter [Acidobacteriota bacterium]